tara:strand:- start:1698 stop:2645 length:948 start_codon:yes stop_codon:yes gene_type:complete
MLSNSNRNILLNRLPKIELSYDKILHNKVYGNLFILIPKGIKVLLWFTYIENKNICLLLTLNKNNNIKEIKILNCCFHDNLSLGTILYGTYFKVNNQSYFSCENIFIYKNINVKNYSFYKKLTIIYDLFENNVKQISFNNNFIILGIPLISTSFNDIIKKLQNVSYDIYAIKIFNLKKNIYHELGISLYKKKSISEAIFKVKPTLKDDIYELYYYDPSVINKFYNYALVSSYSKSVFLNKLFRNIKENINLDLLEESDNEDDFQNTSEDKYVDLNKVITMKCRYNSKFKKWEPNEIINNKVKLVTFNKIKNLENK